MARIDIKSAGATLSDGVLQLENGVAMDTTLRNVADQNNTTSPLKLSTTAVQVVSPFRITTDDPSDMYLDCEDGSANNRFNITRNTASQQVNLNFASNPAGSTTTVGAIRTFTDGVNLGEVVKFREDGQVTFTERVNVEADSLVTTQSSSVIAASTTNANLVIAPNGTGALVASIPDGTATGGNARGQYAVDLQMVRSTNTKVASGNQSTISGGNNNVASIDFSVVSGGAFNTASTSNFATVVGGYNNLSSGAQSICGGNSNTASGESCVSFGESNNASGRASTISGGRANINSSNYSVVSGGQSNTASTNTHATVVGGQSNTSSGQHSVSGGQGNTASGQQAVSIGGNSNIASGYASYALGEASQATANYTVAIGNSARATSTSAIAFGVQNYATATSSVAFGGAFTNAYIPYCISTGDAIITRGDSQFTSYITRVSSTLVSGGTAILTNGSGSISGIPNGNNRMWNVQIDTIAVVTTITGTATGVTVGDAYRETKQLLFKRVGGTSSIVGTVDTTAIKNDTSMATASLVVTSGASQEMALTFTAPTFSGGGSVTCRVVAKVQLVEVAY